MTKAQALAELEALPESEFQEFVGRLPMRVMTLIRGGMVSWRDALPEWYIKFKKGKL